MTDGIIEIGISRNGPRSFTNDLLSNKPDHLKYLGVDIEDKSYLNNVDKNIFTIKENSFNRESVESYVSEIGIQKISILFIDGWHSVNAVINDWGYASLLSENSVVILHDTNYHPGPTILVESINKKLFRVEKVKMIME
jgi:cephalosporin hydroxylase